MSGFIAPDRAEAEVTKAFYEEKHIKYIKAIASDTESFEFVVSQHLRMSGVYWGLTALSVLGVDINDEMDTASIVDWAMTCQDETGGFGGSVDHDPHMLYTLSAIQILALCDQLHRVDGAKVAQYITSLQQADGSFYGDKWGEVDTRFSYCALSAMSILGRLHTGEIDVSKAVEYVSSCRNFDGGFGAVPGAESHAGQIFCCVGALSIGGGLVHVDTDLLGWWLSERQCDSGGLNGRPEKQADVCYSWWILSSLSILGRVSWISEDKLSEFIVDCQDADDGGIADRPGNMADIFHTFFGISGLSLMGYYSKQHAKNTLNSGQNDSIEAKHNIEGEKGEDGGKLGLSAVTHFDRYRDIDPTYALPRHLVEKLGLNRQVLDRV